MSETYKVTGRLHKRYGTQEYGAKGFKKREFVIAIEEDTDWPQYIKFELTQDNCAKLDNVEEGTTIEVSHNLRGRYYEPSDKYFTNLQAWRIDVIGAADPGDDMPEPAASNDDDVPF